MWKEQKEKERKREKEKENSCNAASSNSFRKTSFRRQYGETHKKERICRINEQLADYGTGGGGERREKKRRRIKRLERKEWENKAK